MFFYNEEDTEVSFEQPTAPTDQYFSNVSLLLNMDSDFNDSSANNHTVTVNGNASISTAESKFGGGSGYFDGSGDYLTVGTTSDTNSGGAFAIGDKYTIELWAYYYDLSGEQTIIENFSGASGPGWTFFKGAPGDSRNIAMYINGVTVSSNSTVSQNTWHHIAFTRDGTNAYLFLDGNLIGSSTALGTAESYQGNYPLHIGERNSGDGRSFASKAYFDDVRITKGVARYTANFTPPSEAHPTEGESTPVPTDTYFSNVSLLLNMDSDFSDSSTNNHAVTVNGNASISTTESKFGGGSGYFDGSGDYLAINNLSAFDFAANEFTAECWINKTGFGPNTQWGDAVIMTTADPTDGLGFGLVDRGGNFGILLSDTSITNTAWKENINTGVAIPENQWCHAALVRSGNVFTLYVDGISQWSATFSHTLRNTDGGLRIGGRAVWNQFFTGYIDDVRITKGVARYTANFTPPSEAHPTEGESTPVPTDPSFANVELLLPMDSDFNDVSSNSYVPTVTGGAVVTPGQIKFGAGSGQFNGSNYATFAATPELAIGTQDFTIEMWINRSGAAGDRFYAFQLGGAQTGALMFGVQYGKVELAIYPSGYTSPSVDTTPGQWHHIAATREGGTLRIFVDGNLVQTGTNNTSIVGADMHVGSGPVWGQYFDTVGGYIDDFRLTIGEARYTANFTPPSEAHPTS